LLLPASKKWQPLDRVNKKWQFFAENAVIFAQNPFTFYGMFTIALCGRTGCTKMLRFCEFDKKSIDNEGKILYNIEVKMPSRKPTQFGRI